MLSEFQAAAEVADVLNDIFEAPISDDGLGWLEEWWHGTTAAGELRGAILSSPDVDVELDGLRLVLRRKRQAIRELEPPGAVEIGPEVLAEVAKLISMESGTRLCDPILPPIEEPEPEVSQLSA